MTRKTTSISHSLLDSDTYADMSDDLRSIWLLLILISDDWGRFPYNPKKLARKLAVIQKTPEEIETAIQWLIDDGCLDRYGFGPSDADQLMLSSPLGDPSDDYRSIVVCEWTNWDIYQGRLTWRDYATLPNRDGEFEQSTNPQSKGVSSRPGIGRASTDSRCSNTTKLNKTKLNCNKTIERPSTDSESLDEELVKFCRELVPSACSSDALLRKQVDALDKLIRLDHKKIDTKGEFSPELWKWEVFDVLRWARADDTPGNSGFCWSDVFQSIPRLREKGCQKYINMRVQFKRATSRTPTANDRLDDPNKFGEAGRTKL